MNIINIGSKIKQKISRNYTLLVELIMSSVLLTSTATIMLISTIPSLIGISILCVTFWSALLFFKNE